MKLSKIEAIVEKQLAQVQLSEKFAIKQDPSHSDNFGIVWEKSGTEGGFLSEEEARRSALRQGGKEVHWRESQTWNW